MKLRIFVFFPFRKCPLLLVISTQACYIYPGSRTSAKSPYCNIMFLVAQNRQTKHFRGGLSHLFFLCICSNHCTGGLGDSYSVGCNLHTHCHCRYHSVLQIGSWAHTNAQKTPMFGFIVLQEYWNSLCKTVSDHQTALKLHTLTS